MLERWIHILMFLLLIGSYLLCLCLVASAERSLLKLKLLRSTMSQEQLYSEEIIG
jgi:hypothetical protein